jgi:hypothetical protein
MKKLLLRECLQGMSQYILSPYDNPEKKNSCRVASRLTTDHISALFPDVDSPFRGIEDVVDRLLPYHVFQHPREDLLKVGKGKQKATETDILRSELEGASVRNARCVVFAYNAFRNKICAGMLQATTRTRGTLSSCQDEIWQGMPCYIYSRMLSLTVRHQRKASDDQAYYLERQVLECERAEHSTLTTELRNAKSELERVTRLQRAAALPQRPNYYASTPPVYAHHYRTYHYPYAQTYGLPAGSTAAPQGYPYSVPLGSTISQYVPPALATATSTIKTQSSATASTAGAASAPITPSPLTHASDTSIPVPTSSASGTSSAIPVQLPVSSLPTLHALGIVPVPPQSLSANSPTPPAVLRGTSANGAMLNLEINVSLLQAAQMSGLALVLNSIMRNSSTTGAGEVPVGAPYIYPYTTAQLSANTTVATSSTNAELTKTTTQIQEQDGKP